MKDNRRRDKCNYGDHEPVIKNRRISCKVCGVLYGYKADKKAANVAAKNWGTSSPVSR